MCSDETLDYARNIIKYRLDRLIGRAGLTEDDREDLEQDLLCDLLERLPRFDPSRGTIGTFIARVVEHRIVAILRRRTSAMRDYRREECSLNEEIADGEGGTVERAETMDASVNRRGRSDEEAAELAMDVQAVLEALPDDLRQLCQQLKSASVARIARETGVPRTRLDRMVRTLRRRLGAAGLDGYL